MLHSMCHMFQAWCTVTCNQCCAENAQKNDIIALNVLSKCRKSVWCIISTLHSTDLQLWFSGTPLLHCCRCGLQPDIAYSLVHSLAAICRTNIKDGNCNSRQQCATPQYLCALPLTHPVSTPLQCFQPMDHQGWVHSAALGCCKIKSHVNLNGF